MVNQIILVGRLVKNPTLELTENGKKISVITLAVPRSYKNVNGEYDTDFLDCTLWTGIAESTSEYCKTGDIIGVKNTNISGRVNPYMWEEGVGKAYWYTPVTASDKALIADTVLDYVGMYQSEGMAMSL